MSHDCSITQALLLAQKEMFREAATRGFTHKLISSRTKLSLSVIGQYSRGETAMSGPSIIKMIGIIPTDLLTLLLPTGFHFLEAPDGVDLDALCDRAEDFVQTKLAAHRADSPAGPKICPVHEKPVLDAKAAALKAVGA